MLPRVLITGGAGYSGTVLAALLADHGYPVTIFDCFQWGENPVLHLVRKGVQVVRGDVTVRDDVSRVVKNHDVVVHLAALVGFPLCDQHPRMAREVNVGGTKNVLAASSAQQQLICASSGSVYGKVEGACTEQTPARPMSLYGKTKAEAEKMVLDAGGVAMRLASLFGVSACMRFDLLVNAFVYRAIHLGWTVLYRPGDRRTLLHVADAATGYLLAIQNYERIRGEVFNVGDESLNCTKQCVVDRVANRFPMKVIVADAGEDPDMRDYTVCYARIRERLGFAAQTGLDAGIREVGEAAGFCGLKMGWRFAP
ncbi:MAG: SDR family oxidoreductase [Pirellulales bacterium]|nr:SDR family oxidoreductase [Pirellulales bacterium]